ncbi:MAG: DNA internalization-related competence protein ComEC/Rec2 [Nitrospirae bacterium]|nr:DNA internalization-related competence protein ComEC/Rec2 [Nitrospirota bacterium]
MTRAPLLWMALSFIAGVFSGDFFCYYPWTTLTLLLLLFGAEALFSWFHLEFYHTILILLSFWSGFLSIEWKEIYLSENDISLWQGQTVLYTGTIDEAVAHYPDHTTLILQSSQLEKDSKNFPASGRIKLNINRAIPFPLSYGDEIRASLTLREPHGFRNGFGFDYGQYLWRHGIHATASLTHPEEMTLTEKKGGNLIFRKVYPWREEIREKASQSLSGNSLALFLAMIIGESGYLTNPIRDTFMASGTTHILSISGSHLALVAFLSFHGVRWLILQLPSSVLLQVGRTILPSRLALFLSIPPVFIYGLLAGNQVATNRSMMMIAIFLIGQMIHRKQNLLNPLGLSALFILIPDPFQAYDISFQLSFGSVLAIAMALNRNPLPLPSGNKNEQDQTSSLHQKIRSHFLYKKILQGTQNYLWISLATTLGTAPLVAYHFNQFNWVGILANSVIIPFVGFLVVPMGLVLSFCTLLFKTDFLLGGSLIQSVMTGFYKMVQFFARFPYAELHLAAPSIIYLVLFYTSLIIAYVFRKNRKVTGIFLMVILLLPVWCFWGPRIHLPSRELQVTFLDVGQGDSALIEFPDRTTILVDGGGKYHEFDLGRLVVAPFLWNKGIQKIDTLIATHPQADHIGGLIYVMKKFPVKEVWTNGAVKESHISEEFDDTLREMQLKSKVVQNGDTSQIGNLKLTVLNPDLKNPTLSRSHSHENNEGIVLKVDYNLRSLLLTADIEKEAEQKMMREHPGMKVTLLKVPHHGGKSSADPDFIGGLSPEIALFSVGLHNPYHHPSTEALRLYHQIQSRIYRTDRDGSLLFRTDGTRFETLSALDVLPEKITPGKEIWKQERENWLRILDIQY